MNIVLNTDIDKEIQKTSELINKLNEANETSKLIKFVGIKEFCTLTRLEFKNSTKFIQQKRFS